MEWTKKADLNATTDVVDGTPTFRWIAFVAAVISTASLVTASQTSDALASGALLMASLVAATSAIACFGMAVRSPRTMVSLLLLVQLVCVIGILAIVSGYPICFVGVLFGAGVATVLSMADWWPGGAMDHPIRSEWLINGQTFVRYLTAGSAGIYLWFGTFLFVSVEFESSLLAFAVLAVGGFSCLLYVRSLFRRMVEL